MAVFQVLSEVIGAEEFFCLVALAKLVQVIEVLGPCLPISRVGELVAAVPAYVGDGWACRGGVECGLDAGEGSTGPRVSTQMQRILVPLGFIFVFEAIRAVRACVLLLELVDSQLILAVKLFGFLGAAFADKEALDALDAVTARG